MKVRPIGDNILVKRMLESGDRSLHAPSNLIHSSIVLPDSWKAKPTVGVVIATGRGVLTSKGHLLAPRLYVGDIVHFHPTAGSEIKVGSETYLIIKEEEVLGVEI